MFLKAKLHKESRNGFKTINYRRYPVMIFSKNWFSAQKIIKKLDVLLIFEFLCQYICIIRPVLKDLIAELLESVEILTKCWKLFNFFTCDFLFLKISCLRSIKAYCSYNTFKATDFQKNITREKIQQFSTEVIRDDFQAFRTQCNALNFSYPKKKLSNESRSK